MLITSLFAETQAFHNTLFRYLFAIGHDGLLWSKVVTLEPPYRSGLLRHRHAGMAALALVVNNLDV
ncbi:MAG: hypothetical protein ACR5LD_07950 [Symbiopectobacterium sp.]